MPKKYEVDGGANQVPTNLDKSLNLFSSLGSNLLSFSPNGCKNLGLVLGRSES